MGGFVNFRRLSTHQHMTYFSRSVRSKCFYSTPKQTYFATQFGVRAGRKMLWQIKIKKKQGIGLVRSDIA